MQQEAGTGLGDEGWWTILIVNKLLNLNGEEVNAHQMFNT
jgi:hypothetical protein